MKALFSPTPEVFIIVGEGGMGVPPSSYDFFFWKLSLSKPMPSMGFPPLKMKPYNLKTNPQIKT